MPVVGGYLQVLSLALVVELALGADAGLPDSPTFEEASVGIVAVDGVHHAVVGTVASVVAKLVADGALDEGEEDELASHASEHSGVSVGIDLDNESSLLASVALHLSEGVLAHLVVTSVLLDDLLENLGVKGVPVVGGSGE